MAAAAPLVLGGASGLSAGAVGLAAGGSLISASAFAPVVGALSTLGTIGRVLGGVNTLAGAITGSGASQYDNAAQIAQLQAQADAASYNEQIARQNAELTKQQTETDLERQERQRRLRIGSAIARGGAGAGLTGSVLDVMRDSAAQEELDLLTIESEGLLKERNFLNQAALLKAQQRNIAGQIPLVKRAGGASRGASLLSGASSLIKSFA